ncbi:hypothetical protein GTA62_14880 [Roseobacter sp. HKCCD9010]|uniref:hypothetical protein n=1 Tax=unclassified Roseobacter TaxID=196798 RepID=UPI0014924E6B|nr:MULTISPECIES: hypothetical protein [unclassified Roseobacter]MBF9050603.1 hypothetical protein [Rhodobacterales bacterium HKCCD4356]NNV11978.1 hypothetical protein [Roseobacter sp. HKCCD7357]NNV16991.1 hypothetical protein [Roseobacter sp. HKCCD8768]NNV26221.1 hypothetical protein [Roseobacter sp. HKCCD8192]NNV30716.1 hypothetical protein [Roseobacter sp. HKCCD9061]
MAKWDFSAQLWIETCCKCKTRFGISDEVYRVALQQREHGSFHCPHGHSQHYVTGETEIEKLRRERDRLKQNNAYEVDRRRAAEADAEAQKRSAAAYKGAATRMKNRAKAGVCPCCNRTFQNLARHMASQHPDHELNNVVELGQAAND